MFYIRWHDAFDNDMFLAFKFNLHIIIYIEILHEGDRYMHLNKHNRIACSV